MPFIENERKKCLEALCVQILGTKAGGAPTMSDSDSKVSVQVGTELIALLSAAGYLPATRVSLKGQEIGAEFDRQVAAYLEKTFVGGMSVLRPGDFRVERGVNIRDTAQYRHLEILRQIGEDATITPSSMARTQFRAVTAGDYQVQADVVVVRRPEPNPMTLSGSPLVNLGSGAAGATRLIDRSWPDAADLLHANVSCKWTFRSDRAQNIRTEAIALMRHRKGRTPHMVVVTAEPMPSRLRSIAIGTGEVDCVYHVALPELTEALQNSLVAAASFTASARGQRERALKDQIDALELMTEGDRLRDISDLPFDLAV